MSLKLCGRGGKLNFFGFVCVAFREVQVFDNYQDLVK